jgi:hypothetical protein
MGLLDLLAKALGWTSGAKTPQAKAALKPKDEFTVFVEDANRESQERRKLCCLQLRLLA